MEIGNIAEHNKGFHYLLNCIDIYTVGKKQMERIFETVHTEYKRTSKKFTSLTAWGLRLTEYKCFSK